MNNQELETRVIEIINLTNYFDMLLALRAFEPEYKQSEFYKQTRMPLKDWFKNAFMFYKFNSKHIKGMIQDAINNLDFNKVNELLDSWSEQVMQDATQEKELLENFRDIFGH